MSTSDAIRVALCVASDVGRVRQRNEDVVFAIDLSRGYSWKLPRPAERRALSDGADAPEPADDGDASEEPSPSRQPPTVIAGPLQAAFELDVRGVVFGVCDGMGGAASGHVASRLAADVIEDELREQPADAEVAESIGAAVMAAHRRLLERAARDPACAGMGTTLTAGALVGSRLILAQVGDSRAYVLRREGLVQVTEDQSLLGEMISLGQIDAEQASRYEHANVILQALGVNDPVFPEISRVELCRGDLLLLCTDGLTDMVSQSELARLVAERTGDLGGLASQLVAWANEQGGYDNITLVLVEVDGEGLQPPPEADGIEVHPLKVASVARRTTSLRNQRQQQLLLLLCALLLMATVAAVIILIGRSS